MGSVKACAAEMAQFASGVPGDRHHLKAVPMFGDNNKTVDITVCQRPDGSDWLLGSGASGKVQRHELWFADMANMLWHIIWGCIRSLPERACCLTFPAVMNAVKAVKGTGRLYKHHLSLKSVLCTTNYVACLHTGGMLACIPM